MDRRELLDDPEESLRIAIEGNRSGLHTALPGIIESIDFEKQTVSVQPSIQGQKINVDKTGKITYENVNLPLLGDVPLFFPRGGDYAITYPVKVGDECLVIFGERCIDSWWASGKIGPQIEFRMHDLSDGFAIVGFSSVPNVIPNIDTASLQIRKLDGTTAIKLSDGGIELITDQDVTIMADGDLTADVDNANITTGGDLEATVSGDATITANNIELTATQNMDLNADVINLTCNVLNINAGVINGLP